MQGSFSGERIPWARQSAKSRAGVDVRGTVVVDTGSAVEEFGQAEDDPHQVVRAALVIGLLHGRRDLVVRLGDDIFKVDPRWIVAKRSEGIDAGHTAGELQCAEGMDRGGFVTWLLCRIVNQGE
jgi:hypothetical protein